MCIHAYMLLKKENLKLAVTLTCFRIMTILLALSTFSTFCIICFFFYYNVVCYVNLCTILQNPFFQGFYTKFKPFWRPPFMFGNSRIVNINKIFCFLSFLSFLNILIMCIIDKSLE